MSKKMKKLTAEVLISILAVSVPTFLVYKRLSLSPSFWDAQFAWSIALVACWIIVAVGYYHQGWLVRMERRAGSVSMVLPIAVFFVQCILFVKGIHYKDWSLVIGAILVNSGVLFSLYNIIKFRNNSY